VRICDFSRKRCTAKPRRGDMFIGPNASNQIIIFQRHVCEPRRLAGMPLKNDDRTVKALVL